MTKHLQRDLEGLERRMLFLAGEVEEAVRRSIRALLDRRMELAERVIDGDDEIDRREVELEEECLKVLALHHPVASDLRFIVASLKIENDLERIADLAANIAERALSLSSRGELAVPARIRDMVEHCARMLRHSIDSFVRGDAELARRICAEDAEVDRANRLIIQELLEAMHQNPACIDQAVELISVSKNLERIGDHATNIAEDVVYLVEGDIIRHRSKGPPRVDLRS
ncbi:MAG: phosphate signaling complex protein PhoU [Planctomycetota bacterium]